MLFLANVLITIGAIVGTLCIAHKIKAGFVVYLITEVCYTYIGFMTGQYGLIAIAFIYFSLNIYSYMQWSQEEQKAGALNASSRNS